MKYRLLGGLAAVVVVLAGCSSSPSAFDSRGAIRGIDTLLAGFQPDASDDGPVLLSCPFGNMSSIGAHVAAAAGVPAGTLAKSKEAINPWVSGADHGRAISCATTSSVFGFAIGVQRGLEDEHPTAGAQWKGPFSFGGGNLYVSTTTKLCSVAWARPGTYFTAGVQILDPPLSMSRCKSAGQEGVKLMIDALVQVQPFNVVPSSSSAPSSGASDASPAAPSHSS